MKLIVIVLMEEVTNEDEAKTKQRNKHKNQERTIKWANSVRGLVRGRGMRSLLIRVEAGNVSEPLLNAL